MHNGDGSTSHTPPSRWVQFTTKVGSFFNPANNAATEDGKAKPTERTSLLNATSKTTPTSTATK